ncbi:MAG: molybdopterin-dependent oxidoreductase [Deltaproteobacteria bacterium]|nr:molybdopterin-dependent oxidoreductase [Deltaproteobacteria bacterium]
MEAISLTINGKRVSCPSGTSVLTVAEANGFRIPTLCHHPDLKPFGSCRMCLVEDEKSGRIMASCVTPAAPDMSIQTASPRVLTHRKNIIRLMMAEHPESCVVCSKGNRCRLRGIAAEMGLGETGLYPMANFKAVEALNPFIVRDLSKCILCGKCIRADHELVVAGAIDYNGRGFRSRPATLLDRPLEQSTCTFCGTCVSICPTGALSTTLSGYVGSPEREQVTVCSFCGVGCLLRAGAAGERVVEVNPAGVQESVNGATLCVRGHFAHDYLNSPRRLTAPMIRKENELTPVSWAEALDSVADRLLEIRKAHGPQSIGFLGSSKCTNEENYLFQKMARTLIGCNNVDNGGVLSGRPAFSVIHERTGWGCRVNPLARLEQAEAILMMGADPGQSTPVLSYYIRRAAQKGIPLVGVDVRKTDLTPFAAAWICIRPGRDLEWIYCLTARLWKRFGHDATYIEQFTQGFGPYCDAVSAFNPERLCMESGVDLAVLDRAVDLLKGRKVTFIIGDGIMRQRQGPGVVNAVLNLALMTGSLGHDRAGLYVITRENNQAGAWDMGAVPDALPGRVPIGDAAGRRRWERAWKVKVSPDRGLNMIRMVEAAEKGTLKALYVMGENPVLSLPQHERVSAALEGLDLLVVQDILDTETSRLADVVLPGAASPEKGGSFTNMEGRITRFDPVVAPPGKSLPDWEILDRLGQTLGNPQPFRSVEHVQEEIARLIPPYGALNPMPDDGWAWLRHAEPARLFSGREDGPLIPFSALGDMNGDDGDETYPLTAVLRSLRFHLGSGTRSGCSRRIAAFAPPDGISISPEDSRALNVSEGDTVRIQSRHGSITRAVRINRDLLEGCIFIPTGVRGNDALNLVDLADVNAPGFEGFTRCRVQLKKQGGADEAQSH